MAFAVGATETNTQFFFFYPLPALWKKGDSGSSLVFVFWSRVADISGVPHFPPFSSSPSAQIPGKEAHAEASAGNHQQQQLMGSLTTF